MRRYQADADCPKCGHNGVTSIYQPAEEFYRGRFTVKETMRRECSRCHYWWQERPLDADQSSQPKASPQGGEGSEPSTSTSTDPS